MKRMNNMKKLIYSIIPFILLLLIGCEGDSYCFFCGTGYYYDSPEPMDRDDNVAYLIECLEDEVPVALVSDGYYISGNIEEYSFTSYDYERNGYNYDEYYGIFCLEKGENTYSLLSSVNYNDYDIDFRKLDTNNDGKYFPSNGNGDEETILHIECDGSYSDQCEEPITGSFMVE